MSTKHRHTTAKKLEIVLNSYEIGLRRTEKLYDITKKTIQSWRKKYQQQGLEGLAANSKTDNPSSKISEQQKNAIIELCAIHPQISGREIIERLQLNCSVQAVLKIRKKIFAKSVAKPITECWFFNCLKLSCTVGTKPVYLLTANQIQSGIILFCVAEENIPLYLNAFVQHILLFLQSVGENTAIRIETASRRFNIQTSLTEVNPQSEIRIEYRTDHRKSNLHLPETLRKKISTLPSEFSTHTELLKFLDHAFFIFNLEQISSKLRNGSTNLLLHQSQVINRNSGRNLSVNKSFEQITGQIITLIENKIAGFKLTEAGELLNFLIKISSYQHKSTETQIRIQILTAETLSNSYDYKKALYHYTKALKMANASGNGLLMIKAKIAIADYFLLTSQYNRCESILHNALKQCHEIRDKKGEGRIISKLGQLYKVTSDPRAAKITDQLLEMALAEDDKELFCEAMNLISTINFADGFYEKGLASAYKSLNMAQKYNLPLAAFEANFNIAEYGLRADKPALAEKHLLMNMNATLSHENYSPADVKNQVRLGLIKTWLNDAKNGLKLIEKCLSFSKIRGDRFSESLSYNYLAQVYLHLLNYKKAVFYFSKAAKINEQLGSKEQQIATFSGLSYCHGAINQTKKALYYSNKKLEAIRFSKNRVHVASAYGQIAAATAKNREYDKALQYFHMQLKILKPTDAEMHKFFALANIGNILLYNNDYKQAQSYFKKAEKKLIACKRNQELDRIYYDLARIAKATGKIKKMQEYIKLTKEKAEKNGNGDLIKQAEELLKT